MPQQHLPGLHSEQSKEPLVSPCIGDSSDPLQTEPACIRRTDHQSTPCLIRQTTEDIYPGRNVGMQSRDQSTAAVGGVPGSRTGDGTAAVVLPGRPGVTGRDVTSRRPIWQKLLSNGGSNKVAPDLKLSSVEYDGQHNDQPPTAVVTATYNTTEAPSPVHSPAAAVEPIIINPKQRSRSASSSKSTPQPGSTAGSHTDILWPYLLQYGRGIMALSGIFQKGLKYFFLPGVGYIAYTMMHNGPEVLNNLSPVALGDPVCDVQHYGMIAGMFLKRYPKAMFLQISRDFALVLKSLGMLTNSVGGETHLDLEKYTFSGYAKRGLRSAIASAQKEGYTVEEVMQAPMHARTTTTAAASAVPPPPAAAAGGKGGQVPPAATAAAAACSRNWSVVAAEMLEVDQSWVKHKGGRAGRVWFLNRPPVFSPEPGVRKFIARDSSGVLQAFIFLDAVYEGGHITGYYANVTRMRPGAHPGVLNLMIREVIDRIRAECQLTAPAKNTSVKKSKRKKQQQQQEQQQGLAAAVDPTPDQSTTSSSNSSSSSSPGPKFLSLGLSPLHQMVDGKPLSYSRFIRRLFEFAFREGSGYYPFHSLASAKAKYGAGLHDGRYEDLHVTYSQVYLAHRQRNAACMAMFDLGKLMGFWNTPVDAALVFSGHKVEEKAKALGKGLKKKLKGRAGVSAGGAAAGGGNGGSSSSNLSKSSNVSRGSTGDCSSEGNNDLRSSMGSSKLWYKLMGKIGSSSSMNSSTSMNSSSSNSRSAPSASSAARVSGGVDGNSDGEWDDDVEMQVGCFLFSMSNSNNSSSNRSNSRNRGKRAQASSTSRGRSAAKPAATPSAAASKPRGLNISKTTVRSTSSCSVSIRDDIRAHSFKYSIKPLGLGDGRTSSSNSSSSSSSSSGYIHTAHAPTNGSSSSRVNSSSCLSSNSSGSSVQLQGNEGYNGADTSSNSSSGVARKDSAASDTSSYCSAVEYEWS